MNKDMSILRIGEVTEAQMIVEADKKDSFRGTLLQHGSLPFIFYYGQRRTLKHSCAKCNLEVEAEFAYGSQLLALGDLSRQGFRENKTLLDAVGRVFNLYLYTNVDVNGFESYLYLTKPDNMTGALLNVAYYRCPHCESQYLVLYQNQIKEERPPFEPDEILIDRILQVEFSHEDLLSSLNKLKVDAAT